MALRILIYEDDEPLREFLEFYLNSGKNYKVVGAFPDILGVESHILQLKPHLVILDIELQGTNGIAAIPVIKNLNPEVSIIIHTQFEDDEKLFRSLSAGADGYITKNITISDFARAIEEIRLGGTPFSPGIARKVMGTFRTLPKASDPLNQLTARELEVLKLLVKGYSVKLIAAELHMAFDTARSHLRNLYKKLHVNCGKEAIAKILSERIVL